MSTYEDVSKAIVSLKADDRFVLYTEFLREMFEASRRDLETADATFRKVQGRVDCLREVLAHIDQAEHLHEMMRQSGEKSDL